MKGDTRILDLFLLFRMSKEEIIGLINEKQPVVFVSGEHAYVDQHIIICHFQKNK